MKTCTFKRFPDMWKHILVMCLLSFLILSTKAQQRPVIPGEDYTHQCSRATQRKIDSQLKSGHSKSVIPPMESFPQLDKCDHHNCQHHSQLKSEESCENRGRLAYKGITDFISYLKSHNDYKCIGSPFFKNDGYASMIFDQRKLYYISYEVLNEAASYDGTYSNGLFGLLCYLHGARYMESYYPNVVSFDVNSNNRYKEAMKALAKNENLFAQNTEAYNILREYLTCLDEESIRHEDWTLDVIKKVFSELVEKKSYKSITGDSELRAYAGAYNQVFYLMFRGAGNPTKGDDKYWESIVKRKDVTDLLAQVAMDDDLLANKTLAFIAKNAALELTRMAHIPGVINNIEEKLVELTKYYERLTTQWTKAVVALKKYSDCTKYNLCESEEGLISEIERKLFPNTYTFDDGRLVVKCPMGIDKVQNLYHAVKQVQAQFFKLTQTDEPVEGDVNESLNLIVFGSRQEYVDYANFLYGIATNNGGMYIEGRSTFYTFDRETGLSLESLFRHEYVHYLQGRYWVKGGWNELEIYKNSRLVWFEEGSAELFAGSTDIDGIKLLEQSGSRIKNEGRSKFPTLDKLFRASYSDSDFIHYRYGNAFWHYLYNNYYGMIHQLIGYTRNNDVRSFENAKRSLLSSSSNRYTEYLQKIVDGTVNYWDPSTNWMHDRVLTIGNPEDIKTEWLQAGGPDVTASVEVSKQNYRFKLEGKLPITGNDKALALGLEEILKNVRTNTSINNLQYTVGYLENYANNSADFVVTGPLRNPSIPDQVVADFNAKTRAAIVGGKLDFKNKTTGYATSYEWTFEGPETLTSTDKDPALSFSKDGVYTVKLKVTGNSGDTDEFVKEDYITIYPTSSNSYCSATVKGIDREIQSVTLGNIHHTSESGLVDGYSDFTKIAVTELKRGNEYDFKVNTNWYWDHHCAAWIDWNQDGDFEDIGEQLFDIIDSEKYDLETKITVPDNAKIGSTRMRVRINGKNKIPQPCGYDNYVGEVEDYTIIIVDNTISAIAPVANFGFDFNSVLRGESINFRDLSTQNPTAWEWTFEGGSPSSSTEQHPRIQYNEPGLYAVTLKVNNSVGSDVKMGYVTINKGGGIDGEYCSTSNTRDDVFIENVKLGAIDNSSEYGTNGYFYYSDARAEVEIGKNYNLAITASTNWSSNHVAAFVDWNQDGDFVDKDETIVVTQGGKNHGGDFTIPADAKVGGTRLRIRLGYHKSVAPRACGSDGIGEVEDYVLIIKGETEAPTVPRNLTYTGLGSEGLKLVWDASSDNVGVEKYEIFQDNIIVATIKGDKTSFDVSNLNELTNYKFNVRAIDASGNRSSLSDDLIVNTPLATSVGSNKHESAQQLIYPNPNYGSFTIQLGTNTEDCDVTITSVNGRMIKQIKNVSGTVKVELTNIKSGVYVVEIKSDTLTRTQKIVIL